MAGLPGIGGGLGGLLNAIPVIGGALAAAAPALQGAANLIPGGAIANLAVDAAATGVNAGIDASPSGSKSQGSAITF